MTRGVLCFCLFLTITVPALAWRSSAIPALAWRSTAVPALARRSTTVLALIRRATEADTIPPKEKKAIPLSIQLPVPDSIRTPATRNLLAFPFMVRSLETNWGFGGVAARFFRLGKKDTTTRTSDINFLGLYTLKKQLILVLNATIFFPHEDRIARFQGSYSYYPDNFWGLGNHTPHTAQEAFTEKQFFFNPQFLQRVHHNMYIGLNYSFQHFGPISYIPRGLFDQENIAGRYGGHTSGIGPILSWDTRNNAYSPDRGFFAEIQYLWFDQHLGSDFNFRVLSADLRKFFRFSDNDVLGVHALGGLTAGNTPFRNLEELGGYDMMRGYYGGRFTDKCLMAYQGEYRRHLFWRLGAVAFAAVGEVSPDLRHFELDPGEWHYSYGGGLRFMLSKEEKLNLRVDYGIGKHSSAFYVQMREAF